MLPADVHLTPAQRAARRVGSTLLKWRLDALLGVGGTAAVYAGTHHNRSRVALKILHRELSAIPELRARFLREAYVANSVGHDGAVQVIDDHLSEDGEPVLVMQLLEGQSLDALQAARGVLTPEEALRVADQILDVLAAAHARGIVHRDIKPQNIFMLPSGGLKVLDFGVARLFDGTASMTTTGMLVGTPAFMPPEQAGGRVAEIGPPSDLWAVGATVFTLLTGRFVHEAENAQQHTVRAAVFPARSIAKLRPDLPAPLVEWVDKALAFDIPRRFQTAAEMREALARVLSKLGRASAPGLPAAPDRVPGAPGVAGAVPGSPGGQGPQPALPVSASGDPGLPPADTAAVARLHGLPPPAPKRQLTAAEKAGVAGVFVVFVLVASLVVHRLAARPGGPTPAAEDSGRSSGGAALSAWVGVPSAAVHDDPIVPASPPSPDPAPASSSGAPPKKLQEEARALFDAAEADLRKCAKKLGPKGRMSVDVTFHPDGETTAQVEIRFARTPTGVCVEEAYRSRRVSPFEGAAVTATRMITLQ